MVNAICGKESIVLHGTWYSPGPTRAPPINFCNLLTSSTGPAIRLVPVSDMAWQPPLQRTVDLTYNKEYNRYTLVYCNGNTYPLNHKVDFMIIIYTNLSVVSHALHRNGHHWSITLCKRVYRKGDHNCPLTGRPGEDPAIRPICSWSSVRFVLDAWITCTERVATIVP